MVRQAHHERNQKVTVRPEPVEGLVQRILKIEPIGAIDSSRRAARGDTVTHQSEI